MKTVVTAGGRGEVQGVKLVHCVAKRWGAFVLAREIIVTHGGCPIRLTPFEIYAPWLAAGTGAKWLVGLNLLERVASCIFFFSGSQQETQQRCWFAVFVRLEQPTLP